MKNVLRIIIRMIMKVIVKVIIKPMVSLFYRGYINPTFDYVTLFRMGFMQRILGFNRKVPWPVHFTSLVGLCGNIKIKNGIGEPGYMPGCYI